MSVDLDDDLHDSYLHRGGGGGEHGDGDDGSGFRCADTHCTR